MSDKFDPDKFLAEEDDFDVDSFLAEEEPQKKLSVMEKLATKAGETAQDVGQALKDVATKVGEGTGLADIASGLTSATLLREPETFTDPKTGETFSVEAPNQDFLESYYSGKEAFEKEAQEAGERLPGLVGTGAQLTGAIGTGAGVGKLIQTAATGLNLGRIQSLLSQYDKLKQGGGAIKRIGMMGAEGAALGGATGALEGEARTLEGDIGGTARDIIRGAGAGAVTGAALGGAISIGKGIKDVIKDTKVAERMGKAYDFEKEGTKVVSRTAEEDTTKSIKKMGSGLLDEINTKLKVTCVFYLC
jgi:hypothetical protein